jgi:putative ABC transport system substrate-binding protein
MERRKFIGLLGGAAASWPLVARAQQAIIPVIGFLRSTSLADSAVLVAAFREGLKDTGFVEGQNVAIEYRYADNKNGRLPGLVADLINLPVGVIIGNPPSAHVAKAATSTVPIIFAAAADPVRSGLVGNLNRPGGNVTGVNFFTAVLGAKRFELLRQITPGGKALGVLVNPGSVETEAERRDVEAAAQATGQQLVVLNVGSERDIEGAFGTFVQRGVGGLLVGAGPFLNSHRDQVVGLASRCALPAIYPLGEYARAGGLMSYGASISDAYRQCGVYARTDSQGREAGRFAGDALHKV